MPFGLWRQTHQSTVDPLRDAAPKFAGAHGPAEFVAYSLPRRPQRRRRLSTLVFVTQQTEHHSLGSGTSFARNVRKDDAVQVNPFVKVAMIFGSLPFADSLLDGLADPGRLWAV